MEVTLVWTNKKFEILIKHYNTGQSGSNISPLEQGWTIASLRSLTWQIMNNKLQHFALSQAKW